MLQGCGNNRRPRLPPRWQHPDVPSHRFASQQGIALKRFEMPAEPAIRNVFSVGWSGDGKFLAVFFGDRTAIFDLDASQMHLIRARDGAQWCSPSTGILPGPRIAKSCSPRTPAMESSRRIGVQRHFCAIRNRVLYGAPRSIRSLQTGVDLPGYRNGRGDSSPRPATWSGRSSSCCEQAHRGPQQDFAPAF